MGKLRLALAVLAMGSNLALADECGDYYDSLLQSRTRPTMEDVSLIAHRVSRLGQRPGADFLSGSVLETRYRYSAIFRRS